MLQVPGIRPNVIVYLKTSAAVALKRTKGRARPEEQSLTIEIFEQLQEHYDNWLLSAKESNTNVIIIEIGIIGKLAGIIGKLAGIIGKKLGSLARSRDHWQVSRDHWQEAGIIGQLAGIIGKLAGIIGKIL